MSTGRVVVTSSPLYQPMDTLERLGYEVRVYIRVPDLGKVHGLSLPPPSSPLITIANAETKAMAWTV